MYYLYTVHLIERGVEGRGLTIKFTIKIHEKIVRREKRVVSLKTSMAFQTLFLDSQQLLLRAEITN